MKANNCVTYMSLQSDPSKKFLRRGKLSYDETNKRLRIVEEVEFGSTRDYYDVLLLHNVVSK